MSGTMKGALLGIPGTGKSFTIRGTTVAELRDGKHSRISMYYDSASWLRQLGVVPPTPKK